MHAWCRAHLLRNLRSISDPDGQLWALAPVEPLIRTHHAAREAPERGAEALDAAVLASVHNHYLGALARGQGDNQ
jgi:transposase